LLPCILRNPPEQASPTSTTASSSSAGNIEDIIRLIAPPAREAFGEMLKYELQGRELPDHEARRTAERAWHQFLKHGLAGRNKEPRHSGAQGLSWKKSR